MTCVTRPVPIPPRDLIPLWPSTFPFCSQQNGWQLIRRVPAWPGVSDMFLSASLHHSLSKQINIGVHKTDFYSSTWNVANRKWGCAHLFLNLSSCESTLCNVRLSVRPCVCLWVCGPSPQTWFLGSLHILSNFRFQRTKFFQWFFHLPDLFIFVFLACCFEYFSDSKFFFLKMMLGRQLDFVPPLCGYSRSCVCSKARHNTTKHSSFWGEQSTFFKFSIQHGGCVLLRLWIKRIEHFMFSFGPDVSVIISNQHRSQ